MITYLKVENFKSLKEFELKDIQKFNCFVGLNGSGKTTLLQCFDFLSQLMLGNMETWLKGRGWKNKELCNANSTNYLIKFEIKIKTKDDEEIEWNAVYNSRKNYCTTENFIKNKETMLRVLEGKYAIDKNPFEKVSFEYQGSIVSQLRDKRLERAIIEFKEEMLSIKSLELLSPSLMHKASRTDSDGIGAFGEHVHKFIFSLSKEKQNALTSELKKFYPNFNDLGIKKLKYGWKKIFITEQYENKFITESGHISDGFLRIIAILAQSLGEQNIILYDEIENGINQEIMEKLVDYLLSLKKQIFITTHSPQIINYLDDEIAKKSVWLLYKTNEGDTKVNLYFDYPEASKKLKFLGPGNVYADTPLNSVIEYFKNNRKSDGDSH